MRSLSLTEREEWLYGPEPRKLVHYNAKITEIIDL
jgi:hypothetical protein